VSAGYDNVVPFATSRDDTAAQCGYGEARRRIQLARQLRLNMLDLSGLGLRRLPPEIVALRDFLEMLDISKNKLTTLPRELPQLSKLRVLNLDYGQLARQYPGIVNTDPVQTAHNVRTHFAKQHRTPAPGDTVHNIPKPFISDSQAPPPRGGEACIACHPDEIGIVPDSGSQHVSEATNETSPVSTAPEHPTIGLIRSPTLAVGYDTVISGQVLADDQSAILPSDQKNKSLRYHGAKPGRQLRENTREYKKETSHVASGGGQTGRGRVRQKIHDRVEEYVYVTRDDLREIRTIGWLQQFLFGMGTFFFSGAFWLLIELIAHQREFEFTAWMGMCIVSITAGITVAAVGLVMFFLRKKRLDKYFPEER